MPMADGVDDQMARPSGRYPIFSLFPPPIGWDFGRASLRGQVVRVSYRGASHRFSTGAIAMSIEPLAIGVCSWSLQVKSVPELKKLLGRLGVDVVQIACGDPHHAAWEEGDRMPQAALAAGFRMTGA